MLYARLEPHILGEAEPPLEMESFFHVGLLTYCAIVQGRQAYVSFLHNPAKAHSLAQSFFGEDGAAQSCLTQTGLFYLAIFWYDKLVFHARKFRLLCQFAAPSYEHGLPGFIEAIPFLSRQFYSEQEESLPVLTRKLDDGEWIIGEETWRSTP